MKITGEHLQFLRTLKKVKQPVLARKLGVKQQSISKLENKLSVCDERFHEYIAALNLEMDEALSLLKLFTPPPRKMRGKRKGLTIFKKLSALLSF